MTLSELLNRPAIDPAALAEHLDSLDDAKRITQTLALSARHQARLFEVVEGARPITLEALAPSSAPPLQGLPHQGRNSMYAFTRFTKLFAVPDEPALTTTERWGWNRAGPVVENFVGPGYFVVTQQGAEVLVDYRRLPPRPLLGAPPVRSNATRLSFFVYNRTSDVVRGVSAHVSVGRAWRGTRRLDNWFVLCRTAAR